MPRLFIWTSAVWLASAGPAAAQESRPPVELAVGVTGIANLNLGDFGVPAKPWADVRVTVPISSRFAVEATASVATHRISSSERVVGYGTVQVKQRIVTHLQRPGGQAFLTYGILQAVVRWRHYAHDYERPDGSVYHYPGSVRTEFSRPGAVVFGGGVERNLGSHVAVRADAQLLAFLVIPIGARFTGSVSIPFGHYERL